MDNKHYPSSYIDNEASSLGVWAMETNMDAGPLCDRIATKIMPSLKLMHASLCDILKLAAPYIKPSPQSETKETVEVKEMHNYGPDTDYYKFFPDEPQVLGAVGDGGDGDGDLVGIAAVGGAAGASEDPEELADAADIDDGKLMRYQSLVDWMRRCAIELTRQMPYVEGKLHAAETMKIFKAYLSERLQGVEAEKIVALAEAFVRYGIHTRDVAIILFDGGICEPDWLGLVPWLVFAPSDMSSYWGVGYQPFAFERPNVHCSEMYQQILLNLCGTLWDETDTLEQAAIAFRCPTYAELYP